MAQGLQVFDTAGQLVVDISDSITKLLGSFNITANVAGSLTVPDLEGGSRVFIIKQAEAPIGRRGTTQGRSNISISGRTISWTVGRDNLTVYYGVY